MFNTSVKAKQLSELEQLVMDYVWSHPSATADDVRANLARPLKDSTIRTILRRLEEKGYVRHEIEGRTYLYRASDAPENVAARAVKQIIDRFCGGSVEQLLVGLVDSEVLNSRQLQKLAGKIAQRKESKAK
jgi:BlaI family transcriptional regulator, penicillinase repressor